MGGVRYFDGGLEGKLWGRFFTALTTGISLGRLGGCASASEFSLLFDGPFE